MTDRISQALSLLERANQWSIDNDLCPLVPATQVAEAIKLLREELAAETVEAV